MSAPLALVVPAPALAFQAVGNGFAPIEGVVQVTFSAVRFPDGRELVGADDGAGQALLFRAGALGASQEVWDPKARGWRDATAVDLSQLGGVPILPPTAAGAPWSGAFFAVGQQDKSGAPWIQPATAASPQYRLRGAFRGERAGRAAFGLGPESAPIQFASAAAAAPLPLSVPVPDLDSGGRYTLEGASKFSFAAVRFPDGSAMTVADYASAQAILTRRLTAGSASELWDTDTSNWRPAAGADLSQLSGVPLGPPKTVDGPWQGVLVGADIQKAIAHFPQYRLQGVFRAKRGVVAAVGVGPQSAPIEFDSSDEGNRLEVDSSTATITTRSAPKASVSLQVDGSILLKPALGVKVVVAGDLEAEHIRYRPVSGLPKKDLN